MTKVDLFHNLRVKFNELSLREHLIVEKTTKELEQENNKLLDVINNQDVKIADLEKQILKMKCCLNCNFWKDKKYNVCTEIKKLGKTCCAFWKLEESTE